MKKSVFRFLLAFSFSVFLHGVVLGQNEETKKRKALRITGKIAVAVGKATAKATYETVKFAGREIVIPAFKHVIIPAAKATPPIAGKTLKLSAKGIKNGIKRVTGDDEGDDDSKAKTSN